MRGTRATSHGSKYKSKLRESVMIASGEVTRSHACRVCRWRGRYGRHQETRTPDLFRVKPTTSLDWSIPDLYPTAMHPRIATAQTGLIVGGASGKSVTTLNGSYPSFRNHGRRTRQI